MPMSPREIKDEIKAAGLSMAAIGRRMRPPVSANVVWANVEMKGGMKSARARRAIARAIGRDEAEVTDRLAGIQDRMVRGGIAEDTAARSVENLRTQPAVGTPEQIAETLQGLQEQGMTYAITYFAEAAYDTSGVELFEDEVIPALRG